MRSIFAILAVLAFTANALQVVDEDVEQSPEELAEDLKHLEDNPPTEEYTGDEELQSQPEGQVVTSDEAEEAEILGVYRTYADPNHRKCPRVLYFEGNTVKFTGMDGPAVDGGHCDKVEMLNEEEFTFDGVVEGDKIVIDFSSKGGPKDLTGTISREGAKDITWADGNKWSEIVHQLGEPTELSPEEQQEQDVADELEMERAQMRRRGIDSDQEVVEGEPTPEEIAEANPHGETIEETEEPGEVEHLSNEPPPTLKDDEIALGIKKLSPEDEAEVVKRVSEEVKAEQDKFYQTWGITPEEQSLPEEDTAEDVDDPGPEGEDGPAMEEDPPTEDGDTGPEGELEDLPPTEEDPDDPGPEGEEMREEAPLAEDNIPDDPTVEDQDQAAVQNQAGGDE